MSDFLAFKPSTIQSVSTHSRSRRQAGKQWERLANDSIFYIILYFSFSVYGSIAKRQKGTHTYIMHRINLAGPNPAHTDQHLILSSPDNSITLILLLFWVFLSPSPARTLPIAFCSLYLSTTANIALTTEALKYAYPARTEHSHKHAHTHSGALNHKESYALAMS